MGEPRIVRYETSRLPSADERRASVELAKKLRKVTYPDRAKTRVQSTLPPGRINMRQAMMLDQQRQMRLTETAMPFVQRRFAPTIYTPISVGIMCDISGSMSRAQLPLAVARWVLANAIHQVNGTVATVLFGNHGHPIQAPHERVSKIEVYDADGGHENYVEGFSLIDSALDLIDGHGARLLVIITDGHFVLEEAVEYAEVTMDMCRRAGVAVVWMTLSEYFARPDAYGHGAVLSMHRKTPIQTAMMLGDAVVDEFRRVAPQHSLVAA